MFGRPKDPFQNGNVTGTLGCIGTIGDNHAARQLQLAHAQRPNHYKRTLEALSPNQAKAALRLVESRQGRHAKSTISVVTHSEAEGLPYKIFPQHIKNNLAQE
jgi:hypothetical protein